MSYRERQREEIQVQEYVRLQETFNTIIRSLERIERSDNINRNNSVKRNKEADHIHSEYASMREALITQCLCLQVGMKNPKMQNKEVMNDLAEQVERWKSGFNGAISKKVDDALKIVYQAIEGSLSFNDFSSGELPSDHSQAVGNIFKAKGNLEKVSKQANENPRAYYESNQYGLNMGKKFGGQYDTEIIEDQLKKKLKRSNMDVNRSDNHSDEILTLISQYEKRIKELDSIMKNNKRDKKPITDQVNEKKTLTTQLEKKKKELKKLSG